VVSIVTKAYVYCQSILWQSNSHRVVLLTYLAQMCSALHE